MHAQEQPIPIPYTTEMPFVVPTTPASRAAVVMDDTVQGISLPLICYPRSFQIEQVMQTLSIPAIRKQGERFVDMRLRLGLLVCLWGICLVVNAFFVAAHADFWLNWYLSLVWTAPIPLTIIGIMGVISSQKEQCVPYSGTRNETVIFVLPTVARRDTLPGAYRVIDSILYCAGKCLPNYEVHIVIEEGAEGIAALCQRYQLHTHLRFLVIPSVYETANGSQFKARANEYAMQYRRSLGITRKTMFVYHLDDDTGIGHDTIWSIAHFIEDGSYDLAQGVLTYPHSLSPSWFCRLADSIRPSDDMSRFYYFTGKRGTPLIGCHGEHLLVRASVEDEIGWDFGPNVTVEDAYFGLSFAEKYPGQATFLPSCCYGASPEDIGSLITQRGRWAKGLLGLLFDGRFRLKTKAFLCYSILNWTIGLFQHVAVVLAVALLLHAPSTSPIATPIIILWGLNFSYQVWMYLEGLRMNMEAGQSPRWQFWLLCPIQIVSIPLLSLVEAWSAFVGLLFFVFRRKSGGFTVIKKGNPQVWADK